MLTKQRQKIKRKIKARLDTAKPRLSVYKSNKHTYAQIIDDAKNITLIDQSDSKEKFGKTKVESAGKVGELLAQKAKAKKIKEVVFDRGGYRYHGRVKAVAEGARKGGLKF